MEISVGQDYSMASHVNDLEALILNMSSPPAHYRAFIQGFYRLVTGIKESYNYKIPRINRTFCPFRLLPKRLGLAFAILKFGIKGVVPAKAAISANNMNKALEIFGRATLGTKTFDDSPETRLQIARQDFVAAESTGSGL